jgi:putative tryptophan/tyrosine transport system ATP-binding protein
MLDVQSLNKTFFSGTVDEIRALRDLSLSVQPLDFVTIVGSNGAGKSTLLNAIAGVFECDSGRLQLGGLDITHEPEYRRARLISRVLQDPKQGNAPSMTIEENLAMAMLRGQTRGLGSGVTDLMRNRFRAELSVLGIGLQTRLKSPVGALSGGQRQSVALIMAVIKRPLLLLLDEHTASLDPKTGARILEITDRVIREHQVTALMVTHNMEHALHYGNRLVMMHQGQIVLDISGAEKAQLGVVDLIARFEQQSGEHFIDDRVLLSSNGGG